MLNNIESFLKDTRGILNSSWIFSLSLLIAQEYFTGDILIYYAWSMEAMWRPIFRRLTPGINSSVNPPLGKIYSLARQWVSPVMNVFSS